MNENTNNTSRSLGEIENMLLKDGWDMTLISKMTERELREVDSIEDYDEFTEYMMAMRRIHHSY